MKEKKFKSILSVLKLGFLIFLFLTKTIYADGVFSTNTNIGTGVYRSSITLGDIDNDGDLDLIVTGSDGSGRRLEKYINNGTGYFSGPVTFGTGVSVSSIALGDIDSDDDLDLLVTGWDGSSYRLDKYMNNGLGDFITPISFGTGVGGQFYKGSSITLGDIDSDGDLDLIVTGWDGSTERLDKYINDGSGNYSEALPFGLGVEGGSIALGDIDSDGDLDLIESGWGTGTDQLIKYFNNSIGNYSISNSFGAGVRFSSISLGDIDSDGDLDLIVVGYSGVNGYSLDRYINDGSGNFTRTDFGFGVDQASIALGDIDNDGDLDLIVTGTSGTRYCSRYMNNGSGTFSSPTTFGVRVEDSSIALGDIDNDGDLDLIVSGNDGSVYRLDKYRNIISTANIPPPVPTRLVSTNTNGKWMFKWELMSMDDHTSANLIRYKIAIGTNISGIYNYSSAVFDYPAGQANIGNVCIVTAEYYQSSISINKTVYWKVCAIDSAFKNSSYSAEQIATIYPDTPQWISATPQSANQIDLLWRDLDNELTYAVFRNTDNNINNAVKIIELGENQTSYCDSGLSSGTTYYYWLKAYNQHGASPVSAVISAKTFVSTKYEKEGLYPTCFNLSKIKTAKIYCGGDEKNVEVKIYNIIGDCMKDFGKRNGTDIFEWDGKGDSNEMLSAGLYLLHISGDGINKKVKFMILK